MSMFFLSLRRPEDTPTQLALECAVLGAKNHQEHSGGHSHNLLNTITTPSGQIPGIWDKVVLQQKRHPDALRPDT